MLRKQYLALFCVHRILKRKKDGKRKREKKDEKQVYKKSPEHHNCAQDSK